MAEAGPKDSSGGSRAGLGGLLEPPSPPRLKYVKMKLFGLIETKLFNVHGLFKKNEINQQSKPHTFIRAVVGFWKVVRRRSPSAEGTSGVRAREGVSSPLVMGIWGTSPMKIL